MIEHVDWRGTPINIGDTVIYGSGVGQSIQLNEAEVVKFGNPSLSYDKTKDTTKVTLRIIRRSYMQGTAPNVSVGADRLTVVTGALAPSTKQTQDEAKAEGQARWEELKRIEATHDIEPSHTTYENYEHTYNSFGYNPRTVIEQRPVYHAAKCRVCGSERLYSKECTGSPDQGMDQNPLAW